MPVRKTPPFFFVYPCRNSASYIISGSPKISHMWLERRKNPQQLGILLLIGLFFLAGCLGYIPGYAQEATSWENKIAALDFSRQDDLAAFNTVLSAESILGSCKVREKLLALGYAELQELISRTDNNLALMNLRKLLEHTLPRPEDMFLLREDIFINNIPLITDSPFYGELSSGALVTAIIPDAEQVYTHNLKLAYQKNILKTQGQDLWLGASLPSQEPALKLEGNQNQEEVFLGMAGQETAPVSKVWSWSLKDDYRHDFSSAVRQYIKHYAESFVQPVIYKNTVIMRNAYRLFCLDLGSGQELWSIGPDNDGQEAYHTFRHPHQNAYGNDFFFSGEIVFSELGNRLVAVDIADICHPALKWALGLGEYTLCTKPAIVDNRLICGLVNARGELWFCGVDPLSGKLLWSRYIGLSSFLAPVCTLMAVSGNGVVIATNHGFLACLIPSSGEIVWLKKYTPRRYSTVDYWWKGYFKDAFFDIGSLPYDTQFLEKAGDGLIYYKPRESDYFYILDMHNGKTVQKFYVDPSLMHVLGAYNGKAAFLQKIDSPSGGARVVVADMRTGADLYAEVMPESILKGVVYPGPSQVIFKADEALYGLDLADNRLTTKGIPLSETGWILGASAKNILIGEGRSIKCLSFNSGNSKNASSAELQARYLDNRERLKIKLQEIDSISKVDGQLSQLLDEIRQAGFSADEVFSLLQDKLSKMRQPEWQGFIQGLNNIYGKQVITYRDVQITFGGFLNGAGLMPRAAYRKPDPTGPGVKQASAQKEYQINTGNAVLLPLNVVRGTDPVDFFMLLNIGQIVCVDEKGQVRWERKIFFGPKWQSDFEVDRDWHLYSDNLEVYLYDNALIINDSVNVIAVDVNTGAYLWSMTNPREILNDETQIPPFTSEWSYEARLYFVQQIMMRIRFLDDTLMVSHGEMLYAVDPKTGYCKASRKSGILCAMDMQIADGRLYVATHIPMACIKVFDKTLTEVGDFSSTAIGENKNSWPQLVILSDYVLLHIRPSVHVFEKKDSQLRYTMDIGEIKRYYIEPRQDGFIVIAPFLETYGYSLQDGIPKQEWKYDLAPQDQRLIWDLPHLRSAYYFITKDYVFNLIRIQDDYWVVALDLNTGKKIWQTRLDGIRGRFNYLSSSLQQESLLQFIMTCIYTKENYLSDLDLASRLITGSGLYSVDLDSALFCLDVKNGDLIQAKQLPSTTITGFPGGSHIFHTQNFLQYSVKRSLIQCVSKEN